MTDHTHHMHAADDMWQDQPIEYCCICFFGIRCDSEGWFT